MRTTSPLAQWSLLPSPVYLHHQSNITTREERKRRKKERRKKKKKRKKKTKKKTKEREEGKKEKERRKETRIWESETLDLGEVSALYSELEVGEGDGQGVVEGNDGNWGFSDLQVSFHLNLQMINTT